MPEKRITPNDVVDYFSQGRIERVIYDEGMIEATVQELSIRDASLVISINGRHIDGQAVAGEIGENEENVSAFRTNYGFDLIFPDNKKIFQVYFNRIRPN